MPVAPAENSAPLPYGRVERGHPSGLRVVVEPGGAVPVVAVQLWVRTGASLEPDAEAGAAHLLEHLVFKGAGKATGPQLTAEIEALGGDLNAWTGLDHTAYTATVPLAALPTALRVVTDLAFAPWLRGADLAKERGVVLEELRGALDDPQSVLADAVRAALWGPHAYGRPVLGFTPTVKALRVGQLRAIHQRLYGPTNAVLVVVGPVEPDEVMRALDGAPALSRPATPGDAGGAAASARAQRRARLGARPARPGLLLLDREFEDRLIEIIFPVGRIEDPLHPALDLLSVAMGSGSSARLGQELRHEQDIALDVWSALENDEDEGSLVVHLAVAAGKVEAALRAVAVSLGRIAAGGLDAGDLQRAQAALRADRLSERETVDGRANRAGWTATVLGDLRREPAYEAALDAVSLGDLRAAAAQLQPGRAVVGVLAPAAELDEARATAAWAEGWAVGAAATRAAPAVRGPRLRSFVLDNGLRVIHEDQTEQELCALSLVGVGGQLAEPARGAGLAVAWSALLAHGAGDRGALDFAKAVEGLSGAFGGWSGRSSVGLSARFPTREIDAGLSLVADTVLRPTFEDEEVERVRRDMIEGRRLLADDPEGLAWERAMARLFPAHPWGRPDGGTAEGIARVSAATVRAFHQRVLVGQNLCLAVVGDVDPDWLRRRLARTVGRLPAGERHPLRPPAPLEGTRRTLTTVGRDDATAALVLGFRGVAVGSAEEPAATVLAALLGGAVGGGGRLFASLREEHGLAYSVTAGNESSLGGGAFMCTISTDPERLAQARAAMWSVLRALVAKPVPADELLRVQRGIVEGAVMGFQRASGRADRIAAVAAFEGEVEGWRARSQRALAVTAAEVQALAAQLLRRDRVVDSVVGPPRLARA
ncbi:MAG: insulinase family protein [Deltaproteobacteria bacterium]|nr:insulinase family protein [Deltaproteobacteria bacterium]